MRKYSDDPRKRSAEEKCEADIQQYGLHVLKVAGDNEWPDFAYSIGLFDSFEHPEVIILGLPGDVAHRILNGLADILRSGKRFADGDESDDLLEGYPCRFLAVPPEQVVAHFGWAMWYYDGRAFPTLQLVYPDREGHWPWDGHVSSGFLAQQPILNAVPMPSWATRSRYH